MGVDIKLLLNPVAHIRDIQNIAGILLGCKKIINEFKEDNFYTVDVPNCYIKDSGINTPDKDGYINHFTNMLIFKCINQLDDTFEFWIHPDGNSKGQKLISCRSRAVNVAMALKLLTIFGGTLQINDSDDQKKIINENGSFLSIFVDDEDQGFIDKQKFINSINPLSYVDIKEANRICAYPLEPHELEPILSKFSELFNNRLETSLPKKQLKEKIKRKI